MAHQPVKAHDDNGAGESGVDDPADLSEFMSVRRVKGPACTVWLLIRRRYHVRVCIEPGCPAITERTRCPAHERGRQQSRGTTAQRGYGNAWRRHSEQRRREQPWCSICGSTRDLTVDHPTDGVYCRACHDRMEVRRRHPGG